MATYLSYGLENGKHGIARVFVCEGGRDKLQVMYEKVLYPRANQSLVEFRDEAPGGAWSVASFDAVDAADYCEVANRRWIEAAKQVATR